MKIHIKNIATIQTGYFGKTISQGEVALLQSKYFNENGRLQEPIFPNLKRSEISNKHLLCNGDVLFVAKGNKNFATVYESQEIPAVASTSFFVIRIKKDKIIPEFLAWTINQTSAQDFFKSRIMASTIVSIPKSVLENLEISLPSIKTQKNILKVIEIRGKIINLKQAIEKLKEKQFQKQIQNVINR